MKFESSMDKERDPEVEWNVRRTQRVVLSLDIVSAFEVASQTESRTPTSPVDKFLPALSAELLVT